MNYIRKIFFLLIAIFSTSLLSANVSATADIDSVYMLIGNQATLKFSVVQPKDEYVQFPLYSDTIVKGLEIIERKKADTTLLGADRIEITQEYTIAAYDSGLYYIPPVKFPTKDDTIRTGGMTLQVYTYEIDPENPEIVDIKPVMQPPFSWKQFFKVLLIIWLCIVAAILIAYVVYKLVKKEPILPQPKPKPKLPAHVVALSELDKIKAEKLWQQGREKEFHTQLTDVVRTYIEERFGINAMEMTSDEILDSIQQIDASGSVIENLRQILKSADLVKFAKVQLLPDEDELSMLNSYLFINQTKIEPVPELSPDGKQVDELKVEN